METARSLKPPPWLNMLNTLFIVGWLLVAAFPFAWIVVMSFKLPVDAFSSNAFQVLLGPETRARIGGLSFVGLAIGAGALAGTLFLPLIYGSHVTRRIFPRNPRGGVAVMSLVYAAVAGAVWFWLVPFAVTAAETGLRSLPALNVFARPLVGFTLQHYDAVWFGHAFYRQFINSMIVTLGTVCISLTVGTLAGYALARSTQAVAFWILIAALIFRALPHSVLVTGYLPVFINSRALLQPAWDAPVLGQFLHLFVETPPTLYGNKFAIIMVLVAINQPFTIWMLRAFFRNIPTELDEAARVDGCSHFGAFVRVIVPVMWPGVITTGLFAILLAYNDYLVTSLLLDGQSQTMVPAIAQFFNRDTSSTDQIEAIAAAVTITAPLFMLVMAFQKQIVSGLTAGAVKG